MPNVSLITVQDLVDRALAEAPVTQELPKVASAKKDSPAIALAGQLEKLAMELENKNVSELHEFKNKQSEKRASLREIVKTYLELETAV